MENCHFLIVTFPGQGHINPTLQFSKILAKLGVKVTFSTSFAAISRMMMSTKRTECSLPKNLKILPFSDGYDNGWATMTDFTTYYSSLMTIGSKNLEKLIMEQTHEGHDPITHVVYSTIMGWVGEVVHTLKIPSTLLWIEPTTVFDIYYYYFNGYAEIIGQSDKTKSSVQLPCLPCLDSRDLPSFLLESSPDTYDFALPILKKHFEVLEKEGSSNCPINILVNTFDALEYEALRAIEKIKFISVGPLIPSAYLDGKDPLDDSFGGDLRLCSGDYVEWLNSKDKGSVVYVAFGSYSDLPIKQMEGIAEGLLKSKKPFLWVIRTAKNGEKLGKKLSCRDELEKQGMIVEWCSQMEVLSHSSVGCFLTHCGWNSTMESLVCGVPVLGIPLWTDQTTNAKLIQDVWRTGIRATVCNEELGIVDGDEIRKGLEIIMDGGERSEEMRKNARKWKDLVTEAAKDGGSSNLNLKAFVDEVRCCCWCH